MKKVLLTLITFYFLGLTINAEETSTTVFAVANLALALAAGFVYLSLIRRGK